MFPADLLARPALLMLVTLAVLSAAAQTAGGTQEQELAHRGQAALLAEHYEEAEQAYRQLSRLEPSSPEVHVTLGVVLFREGKFSEAVLQLQRALQLKPNQPRVEPLLAMALSETGRYEEALAGLKQGFRQTADPELRRMCGLRLERALNSLGRSDQAVETAAAMDEAYPADPEVLYYSGKILGNAAYLAAQKLFQVAPHSVWGLMAAGEAHESQGDTEAAVTSFEEVLRINPRQPNVHYRI